MSDHEPLLTARQIAVREEVLVELIRVLSTSRIPVPRVNEMDQSVPPLEAFLAFLCSWLEGRSGPSSSVENPEKVLQLFRDGLISLLMRIIIEFSAWDALYGPDDFRVRLPSFVLSRT